MATARSGHTAVRLANGRVLMAGGQTDVDPGVTASTESYEPSTGTFMPGMPLTVPRYGHAATVLTNGTVLIAGGRDDTGRALSSGETYDPRIGLFGAVNSMPVAGEALAVALPDGRALVVVGRQLELYDPDDPAGNYFGFSPAGKLGTAADTATLLADGSVLLTEGGLGAALSSPEA